MILAGDMALASSEVQGRDVVCAVAILELDGPGSSGQSQQLVTEADTENGNLGGLHQLSEMIHGVLTMGWVARAVGNEDAIKVVSDLVDRIVEGEASDACTSTHETAENILLDTAVDDRNMGSW